MSPDIDNIKTPLYYIWTIVNTVIGNQSLLNVSNWLDHLKCGCLDGSVLIVYVCYWTLRLLAVHYPFAEGPSTTQFVLYMSLICRYLHFPTVNYWLKLYYVVLAQPFHSSLCSVHHSPFHCNPNAVLHSPSFNSSSPVDWAPFPFHSYSLGPSLCIIHHSLSTLAPLPHTAHWKCTHSPSTWALAPVQNLNSTSLGNFI